jgi:hypothetical protein
MMHLKQSSLFTDPESFHTYGVAILQGHQIAVANLLYNLPCYLDNTTHHISLIGEIQNDNPTFINHHETRINVSPSIPIKKFRISEMHTIDHIPLQHTTKIIFDMSSKCL